MNTILFRTSKVNQNSLAQFLFILVFIHLTVDSFIVVADWYVNAINTHRQSLIFIL